MIDPLVLAIGCGGAVAAVSLWFKSAHVADLRRKLHQSRLANLALFDEVEAAKAERVELAREIQALKARAVKAEADAATLTEHLRVTQSALQSACEASNAFQKQAEALTAKLARHHMARGLNGRFVPTPRPPSNSDASHVAMTTGS